MSSEKREVVRYTVYAADCDGAHNIDNGAGQLADNLADGTELVLASAHDAAVAGLERDRDALQIAANNFCAMLNSRDARISQLETERDNYERWWKGANADTNTMAERIVELETELNRLTRGDVSPIVTTLGDALTRIGQLEAGIRKWASECAECGGKGFTGGAKYYEAGEIKDARTPCPACADIRALASNLPASGEG